jgi:hypothetical protein
MPDAPAVTNGAIQTGTSHPVRESISHPYVPIPNTSNVAGGGNEDLHGKNRSTELADSPRSQGTKPKDEDILESKGRNRMS